MKSVIRALMATAVVLLSACGGGGGSGCDAQLALGGAANCGSGTNATVATSNTTTSVAGYTSAVTSGELVSSNWNSTLTQVNYGFVDWPASYTRDVMTRQVPVTYSSTENTYAPQTFVGKYGKNSAGLMYGMISERYNAYNNAATQLPFMGALNLETDAVKRQGIYNVIGHQCPTTSSCTPYYGTFRFNPDGTWDWCKSGDLYTGSCASPSVSVSGTADLSSNTGRITLRSGGASIGYAMLSIYNTQKTLIIQFNDSLTLIKNGMLVGAPRVALDTSSIVGTWYFTSASLSGNWVVTSASSIAESIDSGSTSSPAMTVDLPWAGLAKLNVGATKVVLMSPSGVFVYMDTAVPEFRVGLKKE